jgi:hypothetical protein
MQPQLAPAGAIDVTSRAAPRPTGGPITQRETQRPADGFPIDRFWTIPASQTVIIADMQNGGSVSVLSDLPRHSV